MIYNLAVDDMQCFALMIYNAPLRFALIVVYFATLYKKREDDILPYTLYLYK